MKTKLPIRLATLLIAIALAGCATGTHIVTGTIRPKIKPEQVTIYQVAPAKFEIVGIVNSTTPGMRQRNMDDAVNALKEQAAEIGANGILLGGVNPGSESIGVGSGTAFSGSHTVFGSTIATSSSGIQLSGQAIFVEK